MKRSRPFREAAPKAPIDPYTTALHLLAGRELTAAQLRDRLARRGFDAQTIEDVLARLIEEQAVDDHRAALAAARRALARHYGSVRALRELEALGIDRSVARAAVSEIFGESDESVLLERAIARKLRGPLTNPVTFRRLHGYLVRQGFSSAAVFAALKTRTRLPVQDLDPGTRDEVD